MSTLKDFRHRYSAELLMQANTQTAPGALYDWVGLTHRRLDPLGLNIAHELLGPAEASVMVDALLAAPAAPTQFAHLDLTNEVKAEADLQLPNVLTALKTSLDTKKVVSFAFEGITSRSMPAELRMQVRALLAQMRDKEAKKYRQRIRPYMVVDNLFYASKVVITLKADTHLTAEAKLAAEQAPGGKISTSAGSDIVISYNQPDCPFAAELTKGKDL
ncbi:hypothetical protein [Hymenobacter tenuis]